MYIRLDGQDIQHVDELAVDRLVDADGLVERNIYDLVVLDSDHHVTLSVLESLDCSDTHAACKDTVVGCRDTSALKMAEDGHTRLELRIFMDKTVSIILGSACTVLLAFGHKHDGAVLALADSTADECRELVDIRLVLRNDRSLRTCSDRGVLRKEAGISSHDLDKEDAVVRVRRVADLIDAVHDGVERRIVSDRGIRTVEVVVDGSRKSHAWDVILRGNDLGACKRAVSADDHEGVDSVGLYVLIRLCTAFLTHEVLAPRRTENRTSAVDRTADAF